MPMDNERYTAELYLDTKMSAIIFSSRTTSVDEELENRIESITETVLYSFSRFSVVSFDSVSHSSASGSHRSGQLDD